MPAKLALCLLAVQLILPWTVTHFVTQDGPSHAYSAVTARDLLIHSHSPHRFFYHFRPDPVPNWTSTIILAAIATLAGSRHAERVNIRHRQSVTAGGLVALSTEWRPLQTSVAVGIAITDRIPTDSVFVRIYRVGRR